MCTIENELELAAATKFLNNLGDEFAFAVDASCFRFAVAFFFLKNLFSHVRGFDLL
jgi:hypothetical protein